jgi:hypothetical protein
MPDRQQFAYTPARETRGTSALRPHLPLILSNRGRAIAAVGLLDTGADVNVRPYQLGLELGVVWAELSAIPNLSGNLAGYEARGPILSASVGQIAPRRLAFAWTQAENVPLILGQMNFFLEYEVCFFRARGYFEIQPREES